VKQTLREIEKLGILTSGIDRFNLLEDFAVLDLLALARVCANPLDDMAVALVLISPLFKWSQKDLENARIDSQTPLFLHPVVEELLTPFLDKAKESSVLEFFVWLLKQNDHRSTFLSVYGQNTQIVLEEFFAQIRNFEKENISVMTFFLNWIQTRALWVKRDTAGTSNCVRPMTIHGSKGLEAHTIILLEADSCPTLQDRAFIYKNTLFWSAHKDDWPQSFKSLRSLHKEKMIHEYNRLLYVALTRARDHLYILSSSQGGQNSWYHSIK
jgi:ATP-dependent helicase/nuclease subunit A